MRGPKSLRVLPLSCAILALLCFTIGYVYLINASKSLMGMCVLFYTINAAELLIYPIQHFRALNPKEEIAGKRRRKHTIIWSVILVLQLVAMLLQIQLESPLFFILPGGLLIHNLREWWVNAGNVEWFDYGTYNGWFVIGGILSFLTSINGILASRYQQKEAKKKK